MSCSLRECFGETREDNRLWRVPYTSDDVPIIKYFSKENVSYIYFCFFMPWLFQYRIDCGEYDTRNFLFLRAYVFLCVFCLRLPASACQYTYVPSIVYVWVSVYVMSMCLSSFSSSSFSSSSSSFSSSFSSSSSSSAFSLYLGGYAYVTVFNFSPIGSHILSSGRSLYLTEMKKVSVSTQALKWR